MNTTQPTTNETQGAVPIGSGAWLGVWNVYELNDCDWWLARSLEEAKADALIYYGGDAEMIDVDAKQLSDADLDRLLYVVDDGGDEQDKITFREQLQNMREQKSREENPEPEMFASTEF